MDTQKSGETEVNSNSLAGGQRIDGESGVFACNCQVPNS